MTLTKPILLNVASFDATKPQTFVFTTQSSGSQIVANQLTIRKQSDNSVVYQEKVQTFKYEHTVPANKLSNNEYYNAYVIVYDIQGQQSPQSNQIQFRCYSEPTIRFTNIPENKIITNASFEFQFQYEQTQGERLASYVVNLYSRDQSIISTSGVVYVENGEPPFLGKYLFSGFEDKSVYSIQVTGETINGALISSDKQTFNVAYRRPNAFTLIELKNNCDEGYIAIKSNLSIIEGESNPTPPIYINDAEIDLTKEGSYAAWKKGYNIIGDFIARAWFRSPVPYKNITQFSNSFGETITISYAEGYQNVQAEKMQSYLQVEVSSIEGFKYYIFSNYIDTLTDKEYYIYYLKRINNIYSIDFMRV